MNTALLKQEMANIEEYAQTLCETLEENFEQDSLDTYRAMQMREGYSIYAAKRIEEIENDTANLYKYVIQKGRKYLKIVQQQFDDMGPNPSYKSCRNVVYIVYNKYIHKGAPPHEHNTTQARNGKHRRVRTDTM